jgi:membrane-associated phospholipid phosphatase
MSQRHGSSWFAVFSLALALTACSRDALPPSSPATLSAAGPSAAAVKFWEVGSSVAWNATARELVAVPGNAFGSPPLQPRVLSYVSVAQYNAIVAAEDATARGRQPSAAAAAAGASLEVLKALYPASVAMLTARLAAQQAAAPWSGEASKDWAAGEAIGRQVGLAVVAYAATDAVGKLPAPPNPGLAGNWTGTNPVLGLYGWRTWAMTSDDQFRAPPPPAFGSPAFLAAFQEVRTMNAEIAAEIAAGNALPERLKIAQFWAANGALYLNQIATTLIVAHHKSELEAARILALANMAGYDVQDACFDSKLAYYYIRPSQYAAAQGVAFTLYVGMPNHPSYPSGHSCNTGAYATVLQDAFPEDAAYLQGLIEEAGVARMYGGLHYRFDLLAGREIGRQVANLVLQTAPKGHAPIPLD